VNPAGKDNRGSSSPQPLKATGTTNAHGKRHRRHQNDKKVGNRNMQRESADSERFYEQAMRSNEYKTSLRVEPGKAEDNKQGDVGDEVNLKRSIEMKNGIALRSMNNFHKGMNAITLNNYKVSLFVTALLSI